MQRELERRQKSRQSLIDFILYTNTAYSPAAHHYDICSKLEAVERGEIDRLMIFCPPRHGKSEIASRRFPAWFLGRHPTKQIIAASYNSDLATDFGREVRNITDSPEFRALFPNAALSGDSQAAERWHTRSGGSYIAAGVGTAVTGRGAHILLIDDPVKDREEAESEIKRQRTWDWYTSTAYTRLMPGGRVVLIQTRWHEDDLAGRLLNAQANGGDKWTVLELPALKDNTPLWPEWYDVDALERIRHAIGQRDWSSLYQQSPTPDDGTFFKREWIRWYTNAPTHLRFYGASDYAVTADGGDYTVHLVGGVDEKHDLYITDFWRGQTDSLTWAQRFIDLVKQHKPLEWAEENGQITKSMGPLLNKMQAEEKAFCYRRQFPCASDKPTRAQSIRGRMAAGKVFFPENAPWISTFLDEMFKFPAGKNDDIVDSFGLLGRMIDEMLPATPPPQPVTPRWADSLTFREAFERHQRRLKAED